MAAQQIAMIGLGKMGFNLALNLKRNRLVVFAFDTNPELRKEIQKGRCRYRGFAKRNMR